MSDPITPAQLLAQVANELSASAAQPLPDPNGNPLTLRGAVAAVLTKVTLPLRLNDRPRTPTQNDDLYGHILSLRAEQLQTQALVEALCKAASIDVDSIKAAVEQQIG